MEVIKEAVLYREVAATRFSLTSFPWREVKLRTVSSFNQPPKAVIAVSNAGGFSYRDSGVLTSTCRNRSILWQYDNGALCLLELSMDFNLVGHALRLVLEPSSAAFLGADMAEVDSSSVVLMFSTTLAAYRLVLPHPEVIAKDPALSAVGEGQVPSVLAFCREDSFLGANIAAVFGIQDKAAPLSSCANLLSSDGCATFAYPLLSGSIFTVQLPPPGTHGLPVRSELKESSVMNKLWNSFLSVKETEDAPISLVLHSFSEDTVILALCRGLHLKVWTMDPGQCVLTHNLTDYLQGDKESNTKEDQLVLKKAPFGTSTSLRFAMHMRVGPVSQVSIFQLLLVESQLLLQPINTYRCPQSSSLVDFYLTNTEMWGVWQCRGREGREEPVIKQAVYECEAPTNWRDVPLEESPPDQVLVLPQSNPEEVYLDSLFHPGRFSIASICKALELYGVRLSEADISREDLVDMVTRQVEAELQQLASSDELQHDEYRDLSEKCWSKFYRCCLEYHQLLYQPMGLHQDPSTGLGMLVKKGMVSFVQPVELTDYLSSGCELGSPAVVGSDVRTFIQGVSETISQLNKDVLDSFLLDLRNHGNTPISMAMEISAALHEDGGDDFLSSIVSSVPDLSPVLDHLLSVLDPSPSEDMDQKTEIDSDLLTTVSQLCASSVATVMLGSSLQGVCQSRLCLCRDVLIVLCSLGLSEKTQGFPDMTQRHIPAFAQLLHCYHTLTWLVTRPTLTHTHGAFEVNLKLLSSLEITPKKATRNMSDRSTTLAELFVSTYGRAEIPSALSGRVSSLTTPLHPHWGELAPLITRTLLKALWPISSACCVCEFLLANCQYYYIQDFVTGVRLYSSADWYSLEFLLGQGFLGNGELDKALTCFTQAAAGVGDSSEVCLERVCGEGDGGVMVRYYIRVMRLFEQFPSPSYVIKIAESATSVVSKDDPYTAILWSSLFKHHLELGHGREAYDAMMGNPDPVRKSECLRRLVVVLTEQRRLKELCDFTYSGLEEEVEKVIELRARTVDVTGHSYYDLLYCFHTTRGNHRKAAYVMYEHGLRLGREAPGPKSLHKQANCYCMALNSLRLTDPKYAWVVRPVEAEEIAVSGSSVSRRKRTQKSSKTKVVVLTMADIEREYLLVRAKLSLVQREPSLTTQLANPFVSTEEVISLLLQVGLFDKALTIVERFSLSLTPIFEALASKCVHLSVNVVSFRGTSANTTSWDWLGLNESSTHTTVRENTIADKAWNMLRAYLESHDPSAGYVLQKCVAKKLLSMGSQLPQWLVDKYKVINPAELLKLYLTFDLLEPATRVALEYIDSVMGHGKEVYGIKTALHAHHPSVWLPYSALDHLQLALSKAPPRTILEQLSEELTTKLKEYLHLVEKTSVTMEQEGVRRSYMSLATY